MADGRVLIATGSGPLVWEPSWSRFDELDGCRCAGFDWTRGRQSLFERTETGTARVYFHDRDGSITDALSGRQIMLQVFDPVEAAWEPVFRGRIADVETEENPNALISNVQLSCVDMFDYLARVKMVVGTFGGTTLGTSDGTRPTGMDGVVYYAEGPVDEFVEQLLDDAMLADEWGVVFSGNIDVISTLWDPDDTILQAVRDAADAELPGIANVYCDRFGRVAWHGRFARFDPDSVAAGAGSTAWDFQRFQAGTRGSVASDVAQVRRFQWNVPLDRVVNTFVAFPKEDQAGNPFPQDEVEGLLKTDPTSIAAYGYRGWEAPALIVKGHKTNGNTGADECSLYGDYYIANFAEPRKHVRTVTVMSVRPGRTGAAETWRLLSTLDISDVLHLFISEAGLPDTEFFVEGIEGTCRPLDEFDMVTVTPNLTPAADYNTDVFSE